MTARTHEAAKDMEAARFPDWKMAYRIPEAAAAIGLGESTIWKRIKDGAIRAKRDGAVTLIERGELTRYLQNLPERSLKTDL